MPLAHYGTANTDAAGYQSTGWYRRARRWSRQARRATPPASALWNFPADPADHVQPEPAAAADADGRAPRFTPGGAFGLFSGDFTDVNYSDDGLNVGHRTTAPTPTSPCRTTCTTCGSTRRSDLATWRSPTPTSSASTSAGCRRTRTTTSRTSCPAAEQRAAGRSPRAGAAAPRTTMDLTSGGTVGANVRRHRLRRRLDEHLLQQRNLHVSGAGLAHDEHGGSARRQQPAERASTSTFDATRGAFTITTRVVGRHQPARQPTTSRSARSSARTRTTSSRSRPSTTDQLAAPDDVLRRERRHRQSVATIDPGRARNGLDARPGDQGQHQRARPAALRRHVRRARLPAGPGDGLLQHQRRVR